MLEYGTMIDNCQNRQNTMFAQKILDAICDQVDDYFLDLFLFRK